MTKILLIEDDQDVAATLSHLLSDRGFQVASVHDGKTAFQLIGLGDYDIVVTDLFMPERDGIEMVIEVRRTHPKTPIILITGGSGFFPAGSAQLKNLTDSAELFGEIHTLQKPFRSTELLATLELALGSRENGK